MKRAFLSAAVITLLVIAYFVYDTYLCIKNMPPYDILIGRYAYVEYDICLLDSAENLTLVVPDKVTNYMYDNEYIIAEQEPLFASAEYYWTYGRGYDKDSVSRLMHRCKEIGTCYWIIKPINHKVYGPLSKDSFDIMCKDLKVKISLQEKDH